MNRTIHVAIADDHPLVLKGIEQMLLSAPFINVTGLYPDAEELLEGIAVQTPDIILLDIQMPGMRGDQVTDKVMQQYPEIAVIALTNFDSLIYIKNMLKNGARGYLTKNTDQQTLIEAIVAVSEGEIFIEPSLRAKTEKAFDSKHAERYRELPLSMRETEIVRMLVQGCSNQEIAEKLFLSYNTIRNHRARIFNKLDIQTISELINVAIKIGIK